MKCASNLLGSENMGKIRIDEEDLVLEDEIEEKPEGFASVDDDDVRYGTYVDETYIEIEDVFEVIE